MKSPSCCSSDIVRHFWLWLLLLGGATPATAQQPAPLEVLIVASSHVNMSPPEAYRPVIEKLKAYRPEMIFSENISAEEMQHLPDDSYPRATFLPRYQYVRRLNPKAKALTDRAATQAQKSLAAFPYYHKTRIDLALGYLLSYDRANADYQLYVLDQHMKSRFGQQELAYYNQVFGGTDSLLRKKLLRPNSEYQKIFFPLVYELQQARIYPMDCQQYDIPWSLAWQKADQAVKSLKARAKADSTLPEAATAQKIVASATAYRRFFDSIDTDLQVYKAMDSPRYSALDEAINFYGGEALYGAPGFPTEDIKAMKVQWKLRNEGMCANIVRQARAQGARRVMVAVGASHRQTMREMLGQMPGVKVLGFNDLSQ